MDSLDNRIKEIDTKIKKKDAELQEYNVSIYKPTKGIENPWKLMKKLNLAKGDDDANVISVLVDHGTLLAATSEKSSLITEKSALITEKLAISTELLSTSSKRVENLTEVLIIFTSLLALPLLLEILGIDAKNIYVRIVIFVIFIVAFYAILFNRKILINIPQKAQNLFELIK